MMIRSEALNDFLRFVGLHGDDTAQGVETYSQRTVLAYIGLRICAGQPDRRRRLAAIVAAGGLRAVRGRRARALPGRRRPRVPRGGRRVGRPEPLHPGAGRRRRDRARAPALSSGRRGSCSRGVRPHALPRRGLRAPDSSSSARSSRSARNGRRSGSSPASRCRRRRACCSGCAAAARRRSRRMRRDEGTRHRRRRVHRLEPRARAPRARRRRARARQLLDREPAESRRARARRRGRRRGAARATNASTTPCAAPRSCSTSARSASVPRSVQDPLTSSAVNVEGTLNVQLAARDEGVRRVVFASSSSIYGNQAELPLREAMAPDPDLAVRRREARGGALLRELQPRLPLVRDRRAALLQRLRAAPGPDVAVRSRRPALHHRDRRRASR